MSMIECPECKELMSKSATSCPKCGYRVKRSKRWIWILLGIPVLLFMLGAIFGGPVAGGTSFDAKRAIEMMLKDPDSAKFTGPNRGKVNTGSWCGYVNAKNSFGGYVGDKSFIVMFDDQGKLTEVWLEGVISNTPPTSWFLNCRA